MVDIKPWGDEPDLHDVSDERRLVVARKCFEELGTSTRRQHHALFLVSNDLSSGILYNFNMLNGTVDECLRSPPLLTE